MCLGIEVGTRGVEINVAGSRDNYLGYGQAGTGDPARNILFNRSRRLDYRPNLNLGCVPSINVYSF